MSLKRPPWIYYDTPPRFRIFLVEFPIFMLSEQFCCIWDKLHGFESQNSLPKAPWLTSWRKVKLNFIMVSLSIKKMQNFQVFSWVLSTTKIYWHAINLWPLFVYLGFSNSKRSKNFSLQNNRHTEGSTLSSIDNISLCSLTYLSHAHKVIEHRQLSISRHKCSLLINEQWF